MTNGKPFDPDKEKREAKRIIERARQQSEPSATPHSTERVRQHFAAGDADQNDPSELWGTRIGRGLALVAALALVVWLLAFLARGG